MKDNITKLSSKTLESLGIDSRYPMREAWGYYKGSQLQGYIVLDSKGKDLYIDFIKVFKPSSKISLALYKKAMSRGKALGKSFVTSFPDTENQLKLGKILKFHKRQGFKVRLDKFDIDEIKSGDLTLEELETGDRLSTWELKLK